MQNHYSPDNFFGNSHWTKVVLRSVHIRLYVRQFDRERDSQLFGINHKRWWITFHLDSHWHFAVLHKTTIYIRSIDESFDTIDGMHLLAAFAGRPKLAPPISPHHAYTQPLIVHTTTNRLCSTKPSGEQFARRLSFSASHKLSYESTLSTHAHTYHTFLRVVHSVRIVLHMYGSYVLMIMIWKWTQRNVCESVHVQLNSILYDGKNVTLNNNWLEDFYHACL